ncbi:MAG: hypothetical protein K2O04_02355 [Clostridiales bacterium]|nr:hypothetical protein [Clostridiales bacterium]
MSEKKNLAKEIRVVEEEIKLLEIKRSRSQASLIEALISRQDPPEDEMRFFRTYTAEIEVKREQLIKLTQQLEKLL